MFDKEIGNFSNLNCTGTIKFDVNQIDPIKLGRNIDYDAIYPITLTHSQISPTSTLSQYSVICK